ncbi:unnamed protein product [Lactuca virosa]|uniref:RRM domain-containing protein n=1 Tax=Lactuca virosa TaxID=75947 RepID=A0AAU9NMG6_9ASTR|nr:unnamed protein product [Lactuca virosa]
MVDTGDGWMEVRRSKYTNRQGTKEDVTTFYVSGFHDGTSKMELRKSFDSFGLVADIYIGGRKNQRKQNFAFIRYDGVRDVKAMEAAFQGVRATFISGSGIRDSRTFAQVASGTNESHLRRTPPIILNPKTTMNNWIRKCTLIGEAHSLDHIANLPAPTLMNEGTKYLGGMRVAITFDSSKDAREFLEDKSRWQEWFKRMILGEQTDSSYVRLAWLKINGVPLKYWDEDNFSRIASRFGNITFR